MNTRQTPSDQVCFPSGSPQGCVLSPLPFLLYTSVCHSSKDDRGILKCAVDSVIVSLLQDNETSRGAVTSDFVKWCEKYSSI